MSYPILYHSNENNFDHNGIGILSDCVSCYVTEELNGSFEVEFQYPIKGIFYNEIIEGRFVKCKSNDDSKPQIFRIYRSTKPINGVVKFYGEHVSYELSGYPIDSIAVSGSPNYVLNRILSASLIPHKFTGYSYAEGSGKVNLKSVSVRSALGGTKGSILDKFGGEYEFDNFEVIHRDRRGTNNGVRISYGKNLTDLNQNHDISAVYTGVYPFAKYTKSSSGMTFDEVTEEVTVTLPEKIIYVENAQNAPNQKILIKDFTSLFSDEQVDNENSFETNLEISESDLRKKVKEWLSYTELVNPKLSITLSYEDLSKAEEYKGKPIFDSVRLGDTVMVDYTELGVSASARVAKTKYDCLRQRFDSITVGSVRTNIADTILGASESIQSAKKELGQQNLSNRAQLELAIKRATELLNGANGGVWEVLDEDGDGINDATIWRTHDSQKFMKGTFNGIGLTTDGGRTYSYAMTPEGIHGETIIAGSVTAEKMNADGITAKDVDISGKITADEGFIGDFTIEDEGIVKSSTQTNVDGEVATMSTDKVAVTPNYIQVYKYILQGIVGGGSIPFSSETSVTLKDGIIHVVNKSPSDIFNEILGISGATTIMAVELGNNSYEVYIDEETTSLKVRKVE